MQVLTDPSGWPLWTSDVRPGSTHHLTAARGLVLPALYPHAARGLPILADPRRSSPILADKGYIGAGIGVHPPCADPPAARYCTTTPAATTS